MDKNDAQDAEINEQEFFNKHKIDADSNYLNSLSSTIFYLYSHQKRLAYAYFREVYGFDLDERIKEIRTFCQQKNAYPILGRESESKPWKQLDLSVCSEELGRNEEFEEPLKFTNRLDEMLSNGDRTQIGYGGYGEPRPFYNTDAYRIPTVHGPQWRTIHMGIDLWKSAGSKIYAPYDGKIVVCTYHDKPYDYGHLLIQEVEMEESSFYILYGHLNSEILEMYKEGDSISKGEFLARIGDETENGGWPPHLHVQIITDLLNQGDNFDGLSISKDWKIWKRLCPNPESVLQLFTQSEKPKVERNYNYRKRNIHKDHSEIVLICRSNKQYLYDMNGRRYLNYGLNRNHLVNSGSSLLENAFDYQQPIQEHSDFQNFIVEFKSSLEKTNFKIEVDPDKFRIYHENKRLIQALYGCLLEYAIIADSSELYGNQINFYLHSWLNTTNFKSFITCIKSFVNSNKSNL